MPEITTAAQLYQTINSDTRKRRVTQTHMLTGIDPNTWPYSERIDRNAFLAYRDAVQYRADQQDPETGNKINAKDLDLNLRADREGRFEQIILAARKGANQRRFR